MKGPSCQALQEGFNEHRDGEYQLWVKGKNVTVFCYNMQENRPREYLTLPPNENFAEIFSKRYVFLVCISGSCNSEANVNKSNISFIFLFQL